jgi:hypothetical protein
LASAFAQPFFNFYTLWAALLRNPVEVDSHAEFADKYTRFITAVREFQLEENEEEPSFSDLTGFDLHVAKYKAGSVGATTDEPKRRERLEALESALFEH